MRGNRIWILGATMVTVAVIALGWFLGVSPKLAEGDASIAEREHVATQNLGQEATLAALRGQFENIDALRADLAELRREIPEQQSLDLFLDDLAVFADRTGVALKAVTATEAVAYASGAAGEAATAPADAADPAAAPPASGVFTIPVSITVTGSPAQVLDFIGAVQSGRRLALISGVTFSTGTGAEPGGTLSGYLFVVRGSAPAAPVAASAAEPAPAVAAY